MDIVKMAKTYQGKPPLRMLADFYLDADKSIFMMNIVEIAKKWNNKEICLREYYQILMGIKVNMFYQLFFRNKTNQKDLRQIFKKLILVANFGTRKYFFSLDQCN